MSIDISSFFMAVDDSTLSELSTAPLALDTSMGLSENPIDWSEFPINSNTLIFTVTLKPSARNPNCLTTMENVLHNQQSRFDNFIMKLKVKHFRNIYYVTEKQKNGNYHWHGFVDVNDSFNANLFLSKCKRHFGRSEVCQPYRCYEDWYHYCHDNPIFIRHKLYPREAI